MKKVLNANTLKLIAILAMLIDHIAAGFFVENPIPYFIMRMIGRLTAPIMCFFIAEGYYHTKSVAKYIIRLFIFACLSHLPYVLYFDLTDKVTTSVFLPLLMGLLALSAYNQKKFNKFIKYAIIALCFVVSLPCDWSCMPVLFILVFGIYRDNKKEQLTRFLIVASVFATVTIMSEPNMYYMAGILLSVPLIALYNGELGKKSKLIKWGFYCFYPIHLIILYLIRLYI